MQLLQYHLPRGILSYEIISNVISSDFKINVSSTHQWRNQAIVMVKSRTQFTRYQLARIWTISTANDAFLFASCFVQAFIAKPITFRNLLHFGLEAVSMITAILKYDRKKSDECERIQLETLMIKLLTQLSQRRSLSSDSPDWQN